MKHKTNCAYGKKFRVITGHKNFKRTYKTVIGGCNCKKTIKTN